MNFQWLLNISEYLAFAGLFMFLCTLLCTAIKHKAKNKNLRDSAIKIKPWFADASVGTFAIALTPYIVKTLNTWFTSK